ncbi:unnamed protein product, partial [Prorocentrum cordatum]
EEQQREYCIDVKPHSWPLVSGATPFKMDKNNTEHTMYNRNTQNIENHDDSEDLARPCEAPMNGLANTSVDGKNDQIQCLFAATKRLDASRQDLSQADFEDWRITRRASELMSRAAQRIAAPRRRARDACERGLWSALRGRGDPPCSGTALVALAEEVDGRERLSRGALVSRILGSRKDHGDVPIRNCSQHARDLHEGGAGMALWRAAARGPRLGAGGLLAAGVPEFLPSAGRWEALRDDRLPVPVAQARHSGPHGVEDVRGGGRADRALPSDTPQARGGTAALVSCAFEGDDDSASSDQGLTKDEELASVDASESGSSHAGCALGGSAPAAAPSAPRADAPEFSPVVQELIPCFEEANYLLAACSATPEVDPPFPRCTCGATVFSGIPAAALPPLVSRRVDGAAAPWWLRKRWRPRLTRRRRH